jgi:hypothetical protein
MKNVNISALTTYNFTSVKARFRIAYDPAGTEQELTATMAVAKHRAHEAIKRAEKIGRRTDPHLASRKQQIERAITENYPELTTTQYLQAIHSEKQKSQVVFGEKASHLDLMRRSMRSIRDREQAEFLINAIKLATRPLPKPKTVCEGRKQRAGEVSLRGRRRAGRGKVVASE